MTSLVFVVPAHGRLALSDICLCQLDRVCEQLNASAIVVAEDGNLDIADNLDFELLERPNADGLGRRFNDGFEHAASMGADYVVPLGSDDFVHAGLFEELPDERSVYCFPSCALLSEDGRRLAKLRIPYMGGIGMRIMPTALLAYVNYRPAADDIPRGVDTSIVHGLRRASEKRIRAGLDDVILEYRESDPLQFVDFKTAGQNLNTFEACADYIVSESRDPFTDLAEFYPDHAVRSLEDHYRVTA
jgi:hypothetical protein